LEYAILFAVELIIGRTEEEYGGRLSGEGGSLLVQTSTRMSSASNGILDFSQQTPVAVALKGTWRLTWLRIRLGELCVFLLPLLSIKLLLQDVLVIVLVCRRLLWLQR
jgi:hypothetical protein